TNGPSARGGAGEGGDARRAGRSDRGVRSAAAAARRVRSPRRAGEHRGGNRQEARRTEGVRSEGPHGAEGRRARRGARRARRAQQRLIAGIEAEKNRLALEQASARFAQLQKTFDLTRQAAAADLEILEIRRARAERALRYAESNARLMVVRA